MKISITWVVKNSSGQLKGPYTTDEILAKIEDGTITGDEEMAQYPGGDWQHTSKYTEFYEKILQTLESQSKGSNNEKEKNRNAKRQKESDKDATVVVDKNKIKIVQPKISESLQPVLDKKPKNDKASFNEQKERISPTPKNINTTDVIELKNIESAITSSIKNQTKQFVLIGIVAVAVLVVIFELFGSSDDDIGKRINLIAPKPSIDKLKQNEIDARTNQAVVLIGQDTTESYLEAQNILVSVIENSLRNLRSRMALCLVYKELWPFTKQEAADINAIRNLTKNTRSLNKIDSAGFVCEAIKLYTDGRFNESQSTLDKVLEKDPSNFFLYQLKGEILEIENQILPAEAYYQKTKELSGSWIKPIFSLARIGIKTNDLNKASGYFMEALKLNKTHKSSILGLGLVEYARKQMDKAQSILTTGIQINSIVDKNLESQGLEALVEIYLGKGEKSKALDYANTNLLKNPNKKSAIQLCERLGGCDKNVIKNAKPDEDLLFNCQYLLRRKEFLQAQAECKAAYDMNKNNSKAALLAGEALLDLGQSNESLVWLERAIKADPKNIQAYLKKADILSSRYDFTEAEKSLLIADKITSKANYEVQREFGQMAFKKNDFQTAIRLAEKALKIYDADLDSIILLSKASRSLGMSITVSGQKEQDERSKLLQTAYSNAVKAVELDSTNIQAQINYAKIQASLQGIDIGVDYMLELIQLFPSIIDYRIALADLYIGEERFAQAIDELKKVLVFSDKNKKAMMAIAKSYGAVGQYQVATTFYLKASSLDPSDTEPIFEVAKILLEQGKPDEAKRQFERVLSINKRHPKANYFLGKTMMLMGNYSEAEKYAEIEKKMYPGLKDPYLLVAEIKYMTKNYSECASEYSLAINSSPQPANVYVKAAKCFRLSGQTELAQGFLDLAAEKESGYEEIYKEQGALMESKGDTSGAISAYCKYKELSPNSKDKDQIKDIVQRLGGECGD